MTKEQYKLDDFPNDPFELRGKLFSFGIDERIKRSLSFIQGEFVQKAKLDLCCDFMDNVYLDSFRGVMRELGKHGGLPASETYCQFDLAIKHALAGSYKAAFDNLRCCLELSILSVYFSFEQHILDSDNFWNMPASELSFAIREESAWLNSKSYTPQVSRMLKAIMSKERFADFETTMSFSENIKRTYHALCDFTHVNGYKKCTQFINGTRSGYNDSFFQSVNMESLDQFLDMLILVVEHLVTVISLYNPVVLAELPLDDKFGLNGPIGFVSPGQSEVIRLLIPNAYKTYFENLLSTDHEVLSLGEWVRSRPSLTNDDVKKQIDDFNAHYRRR